MFLLIYTAIFVPYKVCFEDETTDEQFIFDLWVDFSFFCDIILTFFTALETSKGSFETNRKVIALTYLKGWFTIDFLTTIPFQILEKIETTDGV